MSYLEEFSKTANEAGIQNQFSEMPAAIEEQAAGAEQESDLAMQADGDAEEQQSAVDQEIGCDEDGNFIVEKLWRLRKGDKHPRNNRAYTYEVHVEWQGYAGIEEEKTWEPLQNLFEDIPEMVELYLTDLGYDIDKTKKYHRSVDVYYELVKKPVVVKRHTEPREPLQQVHPAQNIQLQPIQPVDISKTCRYCFENFKTKSGRIRHERQSHKDIYVAEFPDADSSRSKSPLSNRQKK